MTAVRPDGPEDRWSMNRGPINRPRSDRSDRGPMDCGPTLIEMLITMNLTNIINLTNEYILQNTTTNWLVVGWRTISFFTHFLECIPSPVATVLRVSWYNAKWVRLQNNLQKLISILSLHIKSVINAYKV